MTIGAHLAELKRRLFRSALGVLAGTIAGWFLASFVLASMRAPIAALAAQQHRLAELNYDSITSAFDLKMQIAFSVGIVLSSPIWLYQVWAFFVPALSRRELTYGLGFFFSAVPLFLAGCAAGWLVVPHIVELLASFAPTGSSTLIEATGYFTFILKLVLAVGIAFVLPVFLVLLDFVGIITARSIVRAWRVALLAIIVFTALATPSADVISMFLLAIPLVCLYFAAAGVSWLHDRKQARVATRMAAEYAL